MDSSNQPGWSALVLDQVITDALFVMEQDILPEVVHLEEKTHLWKSEERVKIQPEVLTNLPAPQQQAYRRKTLPVPSQKS